MAAPLSVPEIFNKIHEEPSKNKKKEILGEYKYNKPFLDIIKGAFDDSIEFLPIEEFDWNRDDAPPGLNPSNLHMELKKMKHFMAGPKVTLDQYTRNKMLRTMLESLHPAESDILLQMLTKTLKVRGLTKTLVKEVYPELLSN